MKNWTTKDVTYIIIDPNKIMLLIMKNPSDFNLKDPITKKTK